MDRPYIFCHRMTAPDGKIMSSYTETPQRSAAGNLLYNIAFGKAPFCHHPDCLSGRVTTDDNFTFYKTPELNCGLALSKLKEEFHRPHLQHGHACKIADRVDNIGSNGYSADRAACPLLRGRCDICPSSHCRIAQFRVCLISEKALDRIKGKQNRRDSSRAKEMDCIPYRQTAPFSLPLFM